MIKSFLKGLVFGSLVGGTGGLLFAPKSGKDTIDGVTRRIKTMTDATNEMTGSLTDFRDSLENLKSATQTLLPAFTNGVKEDISNFRFQAEPRIEQLQEQIKKTTDHLAIHEEIVQGRYHLVKPQDLKKTAADS